MTTAQRKLLVAALVLFCSTAVVAADAPKAEPAKDAKADEKKDGKEVKADPPAEPSLPSKPYPANATPKAFQPKKDAPKADAGGDKPADKAAEKPADKATDKAAAKPAADEASDKQSANKVDKPADKHGNGKHGTEKPADATAKAETAPRKTVRKHRAGHNAQAKSQTPPVTPAMQELASEVAARQSNAGGQTYVVQARDNLDSVIRKTLPSKLFSAEVLRQAYLRANPALTTAANVKLRPGQVLQVPDVSTLRDVIMGEGGNGNGRDTRVSLYSTSPVVAPTMAPVAMDQSPPIAVPRLPVNVAGSANPAAEVSPEEKKKWVRYP